MPKKHPNWTSPNATHCCCTHFNGLPYPELRIYSKQRLVHLAAIHERERRYVPSTNLGHNIHHLGPTLFRNAHSLLATLIILTFDQTSCVRDVLPAARWSFFFSWGGGCLAAENIGQVGRGSSKWKIRAPRSCSWLTVQCPTILHTIFFRLEREGESGLILSHATYQRCGVMLVGRFVCE